MNTANEHCGINAQVGPSRCSLEQALHSMACTGHIPLEQGLTFQAQEPELYQCVSNVKMYNCALEPESQDGDSLYTSISHIQRAVVLIGYPKRLP